MSKYDFDKAKRIIEENKNIITEANLGMNEDWGWTVETVWFEGKYRKNLKEGIKIAGIDGSYWATPTLEIVFKDGTVKMVPCFKSDEE